MNQIIQPEFAAIGPKGNEPTTPFSLLLESAIAKKEACLSKNSLLSSARIVTSVVEGLRRKGDLEGATLEYNSALEWLKASGADLYCYWPQWAYSNALRQSACYEASSSILRSGLKKAQLVGDLVGTVYSLAGLAENFRIIGRYAEARKLHLLALHSFQFQNDLRGICWAYQGLAQMSNLSGALMSSLNMFDASRHIAEYTRELRALGYALKGCGDVLSKLGQHSLAYRNLCSSLRVFDDIGLEVGKAYTLKALGDASLRANFIARSEDYYLASMMIFRGRNDHRGIAYVLKGLGDLHLRERQFCDAYINYSSAEYIFQDRGVIYGANISAYAIRQLERKSEMRLPWISPEISWRCES